MTVTGSMADHRLRLRGSEVGAFARGGRARAGGATRVRAAGAARGGGQAASVAGLGRALALGGGARSGKEPRQVPGHRRSPAAGRRARAGERDERRRSATPASPSAGARRSSLDPVDRSGGALRAHQRDRRPAAVDTLVITARNPAYTAPADFKLDKLLPRVAEHHLSHAVRGRDRGGVQHAGPGRPPARVVGRHARRRRDHLDLPAAHRADLGRHHRGRGAGGVPGRGRAGLAPDRAPLLAGAVGALRLGPGFLRQHLGEVAGRRGHPRHGDQARGRRRRRRRRAGEAGGAAAGAARPTPRAGWRWRSPPIPRSTTAASPTTPGCRSCRTRSPS